MKKITTLTQKDVFPKEKDNRDNISFEDRFTGNAVIFDDHGKIALVGNTITLLYHLPGGGIDQEEIIENGIKRECLEEIGCNIELQRAVGTIDDFRNRDLKHCISYCYVAKVIGQKGEQNLTEEEKRNGLHVKWVEIDKAIQILEEEVEKLRRGEIGFYNTAFKILRDYLFIKEASKYL